MWKVVVCECRRNFYIANIFVKSLVCLLLVGIECAFLMYKEFFEEGTYYGAVFGWWHGPIFYYTIYGPNSVEEVVGDLCEIVCYIIFSS